MLFSTFAVVMAAVSTAAGFTIPSDQPDGVYMVTIHPDGTEEHTRLDVEGGIESIPPASVDARAVEERAAEAAARSAPAIRGSSSSQSRNQARQSRGYNLYNCFGSQGELNHGDTDDANADLDYQCGRLPPTEPGKSVYSKRGCTVAYYCNYARSDNCNEYDRKAYSARTTSNCGLYIPGESCFNDLVTNWDGYHIVYGYQNFCRYTGDFCRF